MSDILIRDLDPAIERALEARAHGRSVSEEIMAFLADDLNLPASETGVGSWLAGLISPDLWGERVFSSVGAVL